MTEEMTPAQRAGLKVGDVVAVTESENNGLMSIKHGELLILYEDDGSYSPRFRRVKDRPGLPAKGYIPLSKVTPVHQPRAEVHGVKHDQGKPRAAMPMQQFPLALIEIARVLQFGAEKYEEGNWKTLVDGRKRYQDAAARHMLARFNGEDNDPESGLLHEAHELCSRLTAFELALRECDNGAKE